MVGKQEAMPLAPSPKSTIVLRGQSRGQKNSSPRKAAMASAAHPRQRRGAPWSRGRHRYAEAMKRAVVEFRLPDWLQGGCL